jgi:hypothetical protein
VKVAYVFSTSGHTASYTFSKVILPQLEDGRHGVEVVGMMFFDDLPRSCARAIRWASGWRAWRGSRAFS